MLDKIGLIAGNGKLPLFFAKNAKAKNITVIACAIEDETDKDIAGLVDKVVWLRLGQLGRLLDTFKKEGIKKAVMIGGVKKVRLFKELLSMDFEAVKLLFGAKDKKDMSLLGAIAERLNKEGIELLSSTTLLDDLVAKKGVLTKRAPSKVELEDIEFGKIAAKEIARLDIGLCVVVKDKIVVAVEAVEGTNQTIKRAASLAGKGIVVVKVSRPDQDMRFELPVVGKETINTLAENSASCLAIEADKTLIADKNEFIELANRNNICVVAF